MLVLNRKSIGDRRDWEKAGIRLPGFDLDALCRKTVRAPKWIHFGPGNIFRGFVAALQQKLIETGKADTGIVAAGTFDNQIIDRVYAPYDNLSLQVILHADGRLDETVIASVAESLNADSGNRAAWERLKHIFSAPELQMASFTITEKGYRIRQMNGGFYPEVAEDFKNGPESPVNTMAVLTALLHERFLAGAFPLALVSMDNFSHNGDRLFDSVRTVAEQWKQNGFVGQEFLDYIGDRSRVSFPWSMIDKITPRPSAKVAALLKQGGFGSTEIHVTDKKSYVAPFVNAEAPQYLVIEDDFPNGRAPLEDAGVYMTDRRTVDRVERMKVCTCLNPLHTALAVFGCLLGYDSVAGEMKDPALRALVRRIGWKEGLPVVVDPGILKPADFLKEVIQERLPNPYIPDTPQRIAADTSQKMAIRYGETIRIYRERRDLDVRSLIGIPLTIAAWCRYLLAVDDGGRPMALSADPMLDELRACLAPVRLGNAPSAEGLLTPILSNERVFGVNLYEAGLGGRIEEYFRDFTSGKGAVRRTLECVMGTAEGADDP